MFMFGEENRGLSYLGRLEEGVELAEIVDSGHFPVYSNPVEMSRRIARFLHRLSERWSRHTIEIVSCLISA